MKLRTLIDIALILFCYVFVSSCGQEENTDGLTIGVASDEAFLIPGPGDSCEDIQEKLINPFEDGESVGAAHFRYGNFNVTYTLFNRKLSVFFIRFESTNSNLGIGGYQQTIAGDELDFLVGAVNGFIGIRLDGQEPLIVNSDGRTTRPNNLAPCPLVFGGVNVDDNTRDFVATGTLTFRGITAKQNDSDPRAVRATTRARIRYEF